MSLLQKILQLSREKFVYAPDLDSFSSVLVSIHMYVCDPSGRLTFQTLAVDFAEMLALRKNECEELA